MSYDLDKAIGKIPDFPKPGILFYDVTGILMEPEAFGYCIDRMEELYSDGGFDAVAAVESRGFLFAAPLALRLGLPMVLLRKKGKLPGETLQVRFTLEYGEDVLEMHKADVRSGQNVLLVDDLIATGGTLRAAVRLLELAGARVETVFGVIGLPFLNYAAVLEGLAVTTLVDYDSE